MGAVEHLKALCCLGLPPESAMVAVVPVLHEIIPHDGSTPGSCCARCHDNHRLRRKPGERRDLSRAFMAVHG